MLKQWCSPEHPIAILSFHSHSDRSFLDDRELAIISGELRQEGISNDLLLTVITKEIERDEGRSGIEDRLVEILSRYDPIVYERVWSPQLIERLRRRLPGKVFIGMRGEHLMLDTAPADIFCDYEPRKIIGLVVRWLRGQSEAPPHGIYFRQPNGDGEPVKWVASETSSRPPLRTYEYAPNLRPIVVNPESLPRVRTFSVEGNSGCPFQLDARENPLYAGTNIPQAYGRGCAFCTTGNHYEGHPNTETAASVFEQIRYVRTHAPELELLVLKDQNPFGYLTEVIERCELEGVSGFTLLLETRAEWILRNARRFDRALEVALRSGMRLAPFLIGIENFSQAELDRFNKGTTAEANIEFLETLWRWKEQYGDALDLSHAAFGFILFSPWTTMLDLELNLAAIRRTQLDRLRGSILLSRARLYPDTALFYLAERDGLLSETFDSDADNASRRYGYYPSRPWKHLHADVAHFAALATELADRNGSRDMVKMFEVLVAAFQAAGERWPEIAVDDLWQQLQSQAEKSQRVDQELPARASLSVWGEFPAPTASDRRELQALIAELDAGHDDGPAARRWLEAGAPFAWLLRAVHAAKAGRSDEAVNALAGAIELGARSALVRIAAARIRFVLRDYVGALADLDTAADVPATAEAAARSAAAYALDCKFELARRLGAYREALEANNRAVALDRDNDRRNVARLKQAAEILPAINFEGWLSRIETALRLDPQSSELHMRAAILHCSIGDAAAASRAVDAAAAANKGNGEVALRLEGARQLIEIGAVLEADAQVRRILTLDPDNGEGLGLRAELALWAGRSAEAEDLACRVIAADRPAGWRIQGALRVLAGDYSGALPYLERAIGGDPRDYEAHVWRGEALLRLRRFDEAFVALNRGGEMAEYPDYTAAQMLRLLIQAGRGDFPGLPEHCVPEALDRMFPGEREKLALGDVSGTCALLERALVVMRGNRRFTATYVRERDSTGELVTMRVRPSPRSPSKNALWLLTIDGLESAEAAFERVHRDYPRAPEPHCYHGELYLYLGDYPTARQHFEQALTFYDRTRWAFIGLGAVELLEGRPERTIERMQQCISFSGAPGPTLFGYRGEALRRLGRLEEAISDLEHALEVAPTRLSSRINLALARDAAGDQAALTLALDQLRRAAPVLVCDALRAIRRSGAESLDPPAVRQLFEAMLTLMRGNRSSTCVTYFTPEGALRVVPPQPLITPDVERRELEQVHTMLVRALGLRTP